MTITKEAATRPTRGRQALVLAGIGALCAVGAAGFALSGVRIEDRPAAVPAATTQADRAASGMRPRFIAQPHGGGRTIVLDVATGCQYLQSETADVRGGVALTPLLDAGGAPDCSGPVDARWRDEIAADAARARKAAR